MKSSLRARLSISYIFVALLCVSLISIVANMYLDKYFIEYVSKNLNAKNQDILMMLGRQYAYDDKWDSGAVQEIGIDALEQGILIRVKDINGSVIWDAKQYNSGMCQQMMLDISRNMSRRYPNWKGEYKENLYDILQDNQIVGSADIGYIGPFYFNDTDLQFINALNRVIMLIGALALLFALLFGYIMAKRLSVPITRVTRTAKMIARGNFTDRCSEKSNVTEITELTDTVNDLAETLQKHESLRKKLTSDVAHELRTPLATLQSHMEAMIDGIWEANPDRLRSCHEEIIRLNKLVGDLEKLQKYESEAMTLKKSEFLFSDIMNNILMNFEYDFKIKNLEFIYNDNKTSVYADRDKLSQVMVNLISNALKHTDSKGSIKISAVANNKDVIITVEDTGHGIAEADIPHIFERFYRADVSRNRDTGGAGIGLAIVNTIIKAHGGTINVSSKPGKGTKFTIILPQQ